MRNVMVIGETGVGKSSLINLIIGGHVASSSSTAERTTFQITKYMYENFRLFDTIGFNDATEKNPLEALTNLANFATDPEVREDGISLIVYLMKKGRITAASKKNYEYFVKKVCSKKVPVLLVVTHCEQDSSREDWFTSQKTTFDNLDMTFAAVVCGCVLDLSDQSTLDRLDPDLVEIYKKKVARTQQEVRGKMEQTALVSTWKPTDWSKWVVRIFVEAIVLFRLIVGIGIITEIFLLVPILGEDAVRAICAVEAWAGLDGGGGAGGSGCPGFTPRSARDYDSDYD